MDDKVRAFLAGFPPLASYRFEFIADEPIRLPPYSGSAWRGLLGHGLRRTVCVTHQPRCGACLLFGSCLYSSLFESPPRDPADQARYTAVPHPFVLQVVPREPLEIPPDTGFGFGLQLIGSANGVLPYLTHVMTRIGELGLGRGQGRFHLERITQLSSPSDGVWHEIFVPGGPLSPRSPWTPIEFLGETPPSSVRIEFLTPLRLKSRGHLIGPAEFSLREWLVPLLWRLSDLSRHHGRGQGGLEPRLSEEAFASLHSDNQALRWRDWTRYSSRQDSLMQMGGLVGELTLSGDSLRPLWPLLRLGEMVHVGKATSMGLGRYRLSKIASLRSEPPEAKG